MNVPRGQELEHGGVEGTPAAEDPKGAAANSRESVRSSIVEILADVLPGFADSPTLDTTPFVDLGMDSLLAAEVRRRLERRLGLRMSMSMFWRHPTIAEMVEALGERSAPTPSRTEPQQNALTELLSVLDDSPDEGR